MQQPYAGVNYLQYIPPVRDHEFGYRIGIGKGETISANVEWKGWSPLQCTVPSPAPSRTARNYPHHSNDPEFIGEGEGYIVRTVYEVFLMTVKER